MGVLKLLTGSTHIVCLFSGVVLTRISIEIKLEMFLSLNVILRYFQASVEKRQLSVQ